LGLALVVSVVDAIAISQQPLAGLSPMDVAAASSLAASFPGYLATEVSVVERAADHQLNIRVLLDSLFAHDERVIAASDATVVYELTLAMSPMRRLLEDQVFLQAYQTFLESQHANPTCADVYVCFRVVSAAISALDFACRCRSTVYTPPDHAHRSHISVQVFDLRATALRSAAESRMSPSRTVAALRGTPSGEPSVSRRNAGKLRVPAFALYTMCVRVGASAVAAQVRRLRQSGWGCVARS
jgi:hypothetical protein